MGIASLAVDIALKAGGRPDDAVALRSSVPRHVMVDSRNR